MRRKHRRPTAGRVTADAMRRFVMFALVLVVALASVGRGLVAAPDDAFASALGPICHSPLAGEPASNDPGAPASHNCCDDCALFAPVALPAAPALPIPRPAYLFGPRVAVLSPAVEPRKEHTPRQSQGPPSA